MGAAKQNCSCYSLHPSLRGTLLRAKSRLRRLRYARRRRAVSSGRVQACGSCFGTVVLSTCKRCHCEEGAKRLTWQSPGSRIRWNTGWFEKSVPQDCHVAALLAMTTLKVCTTGSSLSSRKPLGLPRGEAVSQRLTDGGCGAEFHVDHKETRLVL